MNELEAPRNDLPVVVSRACPFATAMLSDFGGPRSRQRLVLREDPVPLWLAAIMPDVPAGETIVVVSRGRAKKPATIRIRSIVLFSARSSSPEFAHVYVEELSSGVRLTEETAPFHLVRCASLPECVRFVELATSKLAVMRSL